MPYKGETAYTIETGGKFVFPGATLDVALFDTIVDGFQFSHAALVGTPPIVQTIIDNSDVRSRGVEVNGSLRVTQDIRLSGGIVYADAIATKNTPAPPATPVQVVGLIQPRAPKWSGTFDADYRHPLTDKLTFDGLASVEFSSKTYLQPNIGTTLDAPVRNAYAKLDLRLAVQSSQGWEIAVLGKNLSNAREPLFVTPVPGTGGGGNSSAYYGNLMRPRTVVLQLTLHR
jgi:iron complex outermembrane receptor protein